MEKNENMEIKRILDIINSKKILIAVILVIFVLLGYLYTYHYIVPMYQSTSTLLLIPNTVSENRRLTNIELAMNAELITTYSNIAKNPKVLKQAIHNLELNMTEQELLSKMKIEILENTYIIKISVANTNPQIAMEITNEVSKVFLNEIQDIYNLNNIGIVDEAQLPEFPYNINHIKDIIMFLIMGIVVSAGLAVICYIFDNTIKKEEDIENYVHIKSLGNIPIYHNKKQEIINRDNAKSYMTECMNTIRTNVLYMNSAQNAKTILITSCTPQEGKSWVSANIASSFAKINKKVLLIDADMRKGRAHKIFKVNNTEGFSNYLNAMTGKVKRDIKLGKDYIKETQIPNLHILTSGTVPPNPSELLDSKRMKELIAILKNVYDIIIVDAPPCKLVTDSIVLSTIIDSTILVVNPNKTKINDLNEVKKSIKVVGGQIIGAIINKQKIARRAYSKNYYSHGEQKYIPEIEQKQMISVNKVIKQAMLKLEKTDFKITLPKERQETKTLQENTYKEQSKEFNHQQDMKEFIKKQNHYLKKMAKTVSNMKIQLDSNTTKNYGSTENRIKEIIGTKLEELKQENKEQEKLANGQIKEIIRKEILSLKDMEQEKLSKEQIQSIIKQEISNIDYTQDIEKIYNQIEDTKTNTSEMIEKVVNYNKKELLDMIQNKENNEQQIQAVINGKMTQMQEEIQKMLEQKIMKMNYKEQIVQMNDMLTNLKDSYLELSNKINTKNVEIDQINDIKDNQNSRNIIDFKAFKKQKNKKKIYSIEEEILYEELEKIAAYIIPLGEKELSESSVGSYGSTM